jgi:hypothetical protein
MKYFIDRKFSDKETVLSIDAISDQEAMITYMVDGFIYLERCKIKIEQTEIKSATKHAKK